MNGLGIIRGPIQTVRDLCLQIAAILQPRSADADYWGGAPPLLSLYLGRTGYFQVLPAQPVGLRAGQVEAPVIASINPSNAAAVADRVNALRGFYEVGREGLFATRLDAGIRDFLHRTEVAQLATQLLAVALLGIALYAVSFVAGHALYTQRQALAVLSTRGWSGWCLWRLVMAQFGLLVVVALPAGLLLAALTTIVLARWVLAGGGAGLGPAQLLELLPGVAVTLSAGLVLLGMLAALAVQWGLLDVRRRQSRAAGLAWARWHHLDLVLAVLAIPLLAEAQLRGASRTREVSTAAAGDPVGLVLPALALAFLALASLRLLPVFSALVRLGGRDLPARLAGWQLARQPGQHARLALLLSFAVAVGLFSSIYYATEQRNQIDRVAYAAGSDLRAHYESTQQPPDLDGALAGLPGLAGSSRAFRTSVTPGRTTQNATVLGIDPGTFAGNAWWRSDLDAVPLQRLLDPLRQQDPDGLAVPGRPNSLSLWVFSPDLAARVEADLIDSDGQHCRCVLGTLNGSGWRQLSTRVAFATPPRYPLKLRRLEFRYQGSGPSDGRVALSDLAAGQPDGSSPVVEAFTQAHGWWQQTQGTSIQVADLSADSSQARDGRTTSVVDLRLSQGTLIVRPPSSEQPLPALVSGRALGDLGLKVGQTFNLRFDTPTVTIRSVAAVEQFPTLYQQQGPFLILPMESLLARLGKARVRQSWPNELWIRLRGAHEPVAARLRTNPEMIELNDRFGMQAAALSDPIRLALQTTLVVGFAAALAMSVIGFGLHFLVVARSRLSEYAILQANGLPPGLVRRSLGAEQAVLLLYSLAVGTGLGALLAWVMLPTLQVGTSAQQVTPGTLVTVDPATALTATLLVTVAAGLGGLLIGRLGGRVQLMHELRSLA
jgi:hypothetical protein